MLKLAEITSGNGFYLGLEGPDGVGKSTVAKYLSDVLDWRIFHRRPHCFSENVDKYNPSASLGMEWAALKLYDTFGFNLIEERTFLGFAVYNNHDEYNTRIAKEMLSLVTQRKRYMYVFLTAPNDVIKKRLTDRGEVVPFIDRDIQRYSDFFWKTPQLYKELNMIEVDANRPIDAIAKEIMQNISWFVTENL